MDNGAAIPSKIAVRHVVNLVIRPIDLAVDARIPPGPSTFILEYRTYIDCTATRNILVTLQTPVQLAIWLHERPFCEQGVHADQAAVLFSIYCVPKPNFCAGIRKAKITNALLQSRMRMEVLYSN